MNNNEEIRAYLPMFSGFDDSLWEYDVDITESDRGFINSILSGLNVNYDEIASNGTLRDALIRALDNSQYENDVAQELTQMMEEDLKTLNIVELMLFEEVVNVSLFDRKGSDINVTIDFNEYNIDSIIEYYANYFDEDIDIDEVFSSADSVVDMLERILTEQDSEYELNVFHRTMEGIDLYLYINEEQFRNEIEFYIDNKQSGVNNENRN